MQKLRHRLLNCFSSLHRGGAVFGAILLLSVWLIVYLIVGSPVALLHYLGRQLTMPPPWLFFLCSCGFYAGMGALAGGILFGCRKVDEVAKYRGAFFFSIGMTAGYLWYALFFGARLFLASLIMAALWSAAVLLSIVNFCRTVRQLRLPLWLSGIYAAWCFFLSVMCFFCV